MRRPRKISNFGANWSAANGMVEVASEYLALMGEREGALEWLERAESLPFVDVFWLDRCPTFADLRGEPRFARIRALVATRAAELWP